MAANRLEGEVEITLDKRRILKLTWRGAALFSQETGISVDKFVRVAAEEANGGNTPRFDHLALLLWSMLIHEDKLLTIEKAEGLFEYAPGSTMSDKTVHVMTKLFEVYSLRQGYDPKKQEAGKTENPPSQIENLRSPNA
jgi:hypothetical protein